MFVCLKNKDLTIFWSGLIILHFRRGDSPFLFRLSCPDRPVLFWLACPDGPIYIVFWFSYSGLNILAGWLSVMVILSHFPCTDHVFYLWLSNSGCTFRCSVSYSVLYVMFLLSYLKVSKKFFLSCFWLIVLYVMFYLSCSLTALCWTTELRARSLLKLAVFYWAEPKVAEARIQFPRRLVLRPTGLYNCFFHLREMR